MRFIQNVFIFTNISFSGEVMLSVAVMLIVGFLLTRLTKLLRLPNVTGYIIAGILIGPYCLKLIPEKIIQGTDFLCDIALAFIAFGTGEFFKFSTWKKSGGEAIALTLLEVTITSGLVFIVCYWILGVDFSFSLITAVLAAATSPTSTLMTIRQTGARGEFVNTLLQATALDNVVALIGYSVAVSVALFIKGGGTKASLAKDILLPLVYNIVVIVLGLVFGWLMKALMPKKRSTDNRLIIAVALLFSFCGLCTLLESSPLLGCMAMGMAYNNLAEDNKLFKQLNYFSPPILLLFFVRSGASCRLDSFFSTSASIGASPVMLVIIVYFIMRIVGKYLGSFVGCQAVKKTHRIRNCLGLALIPQAGVTIGLATLGARTLGGTAGEALQIVILTSGVLYELIGPPLAKLSLELTHSYGEKAIAENVLPESCENAAVVDDLIMQVIQIEKELPVRRRFASEEEQAFLEAAEEQLRAIQNQRTHRRRRF